MHAQQGAVQVHEVQGYVGAPGFWQLTCWCTEGDDAVVGRLCGIRVAEAWVVRGWSGHFLSGTVEPHGLGLCLRGERQGTEVVLTAQGLGPPVRFRLREGEQGDIAGTIGCLGLHGTAHLESAPHGAYVGRVQAAGRVSLDVWMPTDRTHALRVATMVMLAYERGMTAWLTTAWAD